MSKYLFVIDTNSYAGNFERQMTAYLTGQIGDCGVGKEYVRYFETEVGHPDSHFGNIEQRSDEGCYRPCEIYPTPGYANNGLGGVYKIGDKEAEKESLRKYKEEEIKGATKNIARIEEIKMKLLAGERVLNWTPEACDRDIKGFQDRVEAAKKKKKANRYPSYQSVAIFFNSKPTPKQIAIMKERAEKFGVIYLTLQHKELGNEDLMYTAPPIKILGFRLIEETTTTTAIEI